MHGSTPLTTRLLDPQHMVLTAPVHTWAEQALAAMREITAANDGVSPRRLNTGHTVHPQAFARLIEALVALEPVTNAPVSDELIALAGLVPADQAVAE